MSHQDSNNRGTYSHLSILTLSRLLSSDGLSLHGGIYKKQLETLSGRDLGAYLSPLSLIYSFLNCIMLFYTLDTVYFRSQSIFVSSIANLSAIGAIFTFCLTQRDESAWLPGNRMALMIKTHGMSDNIANRSQVYQNSIACKSQAPITGVFILWR